VGGGRLIDPAVDALTLLLDDVPQLLADVLDGRIEVRAVQLFLSPLPELLDHVAQTLKSVAAGPLSAAHHQPVERALEVWLLEEVLGQKVEQLLRVEGAYFLGAVPSG